MIYFFILYFLDINSLTLIKIKHIMNYRITIIFFKGGSMKIIITYLLSLLFVLSFLILTPINDQNLIRYESTHPTILLPEDISIYSKEIIYQYDLSYIKSFDKNLYTPKYHVKYEGVFSRDWEHNSKIDYASDPNLIINAHLLNDKNDTYYILLNFFINDNLINERIDFEILFKDINYTNIFNGGLLTHKNKEYVFKKDLLSKENNSFYFYNEKDFNRGISSTSIDGVLLIKLDDDINGYLEAHINAYEPKNHNPSIKLGFNNFNKISNETLIPQTLILFHKEEI